MSDRQAFAFIAHPGKFSAPATPRLSVLLAVPFFALSLILQLPGNVPYDGITVWYEAETAQLYAQHPAALVLVWHLAEAVVRGPALFTALQLVSLWTAACILVSRIRPSLWLAACFYLLLLVYPPLFAMSAVTVKDVFGGHLVVLGFMLAIPVRGKSHGAGLWCAAFACATLATLFRYQLGLMLPVLAIFLWREVRSHPRILVPSAAGAVVGMLVTYGAVALAVMALFTQTGTGDVRLSLRKMMVFDIAGIVTNDPSAQLPLFARSGVDAEGLKAAMRRDYSPVRVDTLWQENGVGNSITTTHGVFGKLRSVPDKAVFTQWAMSSRSHPGPLIEHRLHAFARVLGFGEIYQCRPIRAGISQLPETQARFVMAHNYRAPISATVMESRFFPVGMLFRSWLYALICLAVVGAGFWGAPREAVLLSGFALAYEASFFFLPQACEVRYSYPEMLAAIFALAILAFTSRRRLSE